jgi:large subunit ribosomal protein L3
MLKSFLGKKVGMTQVFDEKGNVIPVTVIDISNCLVTQIKTIEKDGYASLQLGHLKNKFLNADFAQSWLSKKKSFFRILKEVRGESVEDVSVGSPVGFDLIALQEGNLVNVTGKNRGLGFQGVVKRWNFAGGPSSHGSNFHRKPGSIGNMCSQGKVVKGKKLPGQCGGKQITVKGLRVIKIEKEKGCLFVKGAVPGKKNSFVVVRKQGT